MEAALLSLANGLMYGLSYGLLLFMLSAGLTLVFSMMGVLNFAHAGFYMLGAYLAYATGERAGFAAALVLAPAGVALLGALFQRHVLRRLHGAGHVPELLVTFGLSVVILEVVQLVWGRGPVDYPIPQALRGPLLVAGGVQFPAYRAFMMAVALAMLGALWLLLARTRVGLVVRAALTHPDMVSALGHDVPKVFMGVFAAGAGLAGLAGVIGGNAFVTEPGMAATVGSVVFVVVVVGGLGSLAGAFAASLLIGLLQTLAVGVDTSLRDLLGPLAAGDAALWRLKVSQLAPVLPYLLMVGMLAVRPQGLFGRREA